MTEEDLHYYTTCNILGVLNERDVEILIEKYRTLQQQNKTLLEGIEKLLEYFKNKPVHPNFWDDLAEIRKMVESIKK